MVGCLAGWIRRYGWLAGWIRRYGWWLAEGWLAESAAMAGWLAGWIRRSSSLAGWLNPPLWLAGWFSRDGWSLAGWLADSAADWLIPPLWLTGWIRRCGWLAGWRGKSAAAPGWLAGWNQNTGPWCSTNDTLASNNARPFVTKVRQSWKANDLYSICHERIARWGCLLIGQPHVSHGSFEMGVQSRLTQSHSWSYCTIERQIQRSTLRGEFWIGTICDTCLFLNLTWDVDGGGWLKPHIVNGNQPAKVTTCGLMRRHCAAERSAQRHGHKAASIGINRLGVGQVSGKLAS